jgi:putative component of membrane protein insertase Oxa1/YidC/SpoIIIJ protein YidD
MMPKFLNSSISILLLVFCYVDSVSAQDSISDFKLVLEEKTEIEKSDDKTETKKFLQKINPLAFLYNNSLGFYQKNISVQIAANCVFEKTCSHFSKDLTQEFGVFGGVILSIDRLSRCNRISALETSPLNINEEGKIKESVDDYRF